MNVKTPGDWLLRLYRQSFGYFLFGSADYFKSGERFTPEPLRSLGKEALFCGDVPGIDWIILTECRVCRDKYDKQYLTYCAENLFKKIGRKRREAGEGEYRQRSAQGEV